MWRALRYVIAFSLVLLYVAWAYWGKDAIHYRAALGEGAAYAQAYIPPTGAQAVVPYGVFASASATGATATFPVGIIGPMVTLAGTNSPGVPVVVLSAPPVSIGTVNVNATAIQFIQPTGTYSAVPVSVISQLPISVNATAVQQVVPTGTFSVSVFNTVGVVLWPSPVVTAFIANTPAVQGSVSLNNTAGVIIWNASTSPVPIATGSGNFLANVAIAVTPPMPTVYITGAPAPAGSVFIANTPAIQGSVSVNNTPAIQGSVSILNTPAIQGSVSINNTPAIQGSVSILNTPAVQGSVSINNTPGFKEQGTPAVQGTVGIQGAAGYALYILKTLPGAYFRLDDPSGNFTDVSGNGNNASPTGAWTYSTAGALVEPDNAVANSAATGAIANITANTPSLPTGDTFGAMFWMKRNATATVQTVFGQGTNGFLAQFRSNDSMYIVKNNNATLLCHGKTAVTDTTTWHFFGLNKSGANCQVWQDGVDISTPDSTASLAAADSSLMIGANNATAIPMNANLDELAIYTATVAFETYRNAYLLGSNGRVNAGIQNTPAVQIWNTPAVQGSVSIANTPAVQGSVSINNTPAVQGSVSILNTPAVQGSVSINNTPAIQGTVTLPSADPCQNPGNIKLSTPLAFPSGGVTQILFTPSAAQNITICGYQFTMAGNGTFNLAAASATASAICPSLVNITGPIGVNASSVPVSFGGGAGIAKLGVGQKLCANAVGTGIAVNGIVSYVAQ